MLGGFVIYEENIYVHKVYLSLKYLSVSVNYFRCSHINIMYGEGMSGLTDE